jgi:hypothetical protein
MSPELSNSPAPGASRDRPLWVREDQGAAARLTGVLDLALKVASAAYLLMAAWQVAKVLNPALQVRQDLAVAALRARVRRAGQQILERDLPPAPAADRAAIYDDTR